MGMRMKWYSTVEEYICIYICGLLSNGKIVCEKKVVFLTTEIAAKVSVVVVVVVNRRGVSVVGGIFQVEG